MTLPSRYMHPSRSSAPSVPCRTPTPIPQTSSGREGLWQDGWCQWRSRDREMDVRLKALCVSIIHINRGLSKHASWYINLDSRPVVKQSLTITVMTGLKDTQIQVVSVTVKAAELRGRINDRVNGTDDKFPCCVLFLT
jgi:hypothetical protein